MKLFFLRLTLLSLFVLSEYRVFAQSANSTAISDPVDSLYRAGEFADAISLSKKWIGAEWARPEPDHSRIIQELCRLGMMDSEFGLYPEADSILNLALHEAAKGGAQTGLDSADALNYLGRLRYWQAKYMEADSLFRLTLILRAQKMDSLQTKNALTWCYMGYNDYELENYKEAEKVLEMAIAIQELGGAKAKQRLATSLCMLAQVYIIQDQTNRGYQMAKRAFEFRKKYLPPGHVDVAESLNQLSRNKDDLDHEEEYLTLALQIRELGFGPNHPLVAESLNNLGLKYRDEKNLKKAEELLSRAIEIWDKNFNYPHPGEGWPVYNLALVYDDSKDYEKADSLYKKALAIWKNSLGQTHFDLYYPLSGLAGMNFHLKKYAVAESYTNQAITICQKAWGPNDPVLVNLLYLLWKIYKETNRKEEAKAVAERLKQLGVNPAKLR
jgi:tetratricopeptide (TPR) repeat protein